MSQGHFIFKFNTVIGLLKRFPGVLDTGEMLGIDEVKHFLKRRIKCICIVNNKLQLFMLDYFKGCSNGLKFEKTRKRLAGVRDTGNT